MLAIIAVLLLPVLYIIGLILFTAFGILNLVKGFQTVDGQKSPGKIAGGFILIGLAHFLIALVFILLAYLSSHPIAFM